MGVNLKRFVGCPESNYKPIVMFSKDELAYLARNDSKIPGQRISATLFKRNEKIINSLINKEV